MRNPRLRLRPNLLLERFGVLHYLDYPWNFRIVITPAMPLRSIALAGGAVLADSAETIIDAMNHTGLPISYVDISWRGGLGKRLRERDSSHDKRYTTVKEMIDHRNGALSVLVH